MGELQSAGFSKAEAAQLRKLVGLLHERELTTVLEGLAALVDEWRAGRINAFELSDAIHEVHGENRALWGLYSSGMREDVFVKLAIERGAISPDELPKQLRKKLEKPALRTAPKPGPK